MLLTKAGFKWGYEGVPFKDRVTWLSDGKYPDACFDHVFHQDGEGVRVISVEPVSDHGGISDHVPVMAILEIK